MKHLLSENAGANIHFYLKYYNTISYRFFSNIYPNNMYPQNSPFQKVTNVDLLHQEPININKLKNLLFFNTKKLIK